MGGLAGKIYRTNWTASPVGWSQWLAAFDLVSTWRYMSGPTAAARELCSSPKEEAESAVGLKSRWTEPWLQGPGCGPLR